MEKCMTLSGGETLCWEEPDPPPSQGKPIFFLPISSSPAGDEGAGERKRRKRQKITSLKIQPWLVDRLHELVRRGIYPTRDEAVREAIRILLESPPANPITWRMPKPGERIMRDSIAIRVPEELLVKLDELVRKGIYPNRSEAIRDAIRRLIEKWET